MAGEHGLEDGLFAEFTRESQLQFVRTAIQEQAEDVFVTKFAGDDMHRLLRPERPDVNGSTRPWVIFGEIFVGNTRSYTCRISFEVLAHKLQVSQSGGHKNVRAAASRHQVTRHVLPVTHHVLGGRRFMVYIERVYVGAILQQTFGNLFGSSEVPEAFALRRLVRVPTQDWSRQAP